ncbi:MAG: gfo/Idh/MocA family oxidoreductase, partial [Chitinophagaceae bacterium]|nr:gfo/Idh/MocA family oxidoreductase [Chitinophagaceae bacterium]
MANSSSRRKFLKNIGGSTMLMAGGSVLTTLAARKNEAVTLAWEPKKYSANDKVRVALIGTGIQGN